MTKLRLFFSDMLIFACFMFCSCPMFSALEDSEIVKNVEPLTWSDDYVFSGNNSCSIQVWNSKTGKFVKELNLYVEGNRALFIMDMQVLEKSVWIIGFGKSYNLIRIDLESGKLEYKDFSYDGFNSRPYSIKAVCKEIDGIGSLWVNSYGNRENGMLFACYNSDGSLREKFVIEHNLCSSKLNIMYHDNQYIMFGRHDNDCLNSNMEQDCYKIVNLSKKNVTPISYLSFFGNDFINKKFGNIGIDTFSANIQRFDAENKNIICATVTTGYLENYLDETISERILFELKSFSPFNVEYMNLSLKKKHIGKIIHSKEKYYIVYNPIYPKDDFLGLEIGVYDEIGGEQKKYASLPNANQIFSQTKNGCTWFSTNKYKYIGNGQTDKNGKPEIYMLEHDTGNVYKYFSDRVRIKIDYIN